MSFFSRLFKSHPSPVDASTEWRLLWTKHASAIAPNVELATTKQQLVVTCAGVIDKIWNGNGGGGWDESCENDYLDPLREHLCSDPVFSPEEQSEIRDCLDQIAAIGRNNVAVEASADEDAQFESDHGAADRLVASLCFGAGVTRSRSRSETTRSTTATINDASPLALFGFFRRAKLELF